MGIGDLAIDISPDNLCNSGGEEFPDGSLKVFRDHLEYLLGKNHDEIHRVQQCYGYGRGYGGYGRGYGGYGGYGYGKRSADVPWQSTMDQSSVRPFRFTSDTL